MDFCLLIKGIFEDDYINQDVPSLSIDLDMEISFDDDDLMFYDKLPSYYYDDDQWSQCTNLKCKFCSGKCFEKVWFIPINISMTKSKIQKTPVMKVNGAFCSPPCVKSFMDGHRDIVSNREDSERLLLMMCKRWLGVNLSFIPAAHDPYSKKYFKGSSGIDEFVYYKMNMDLILNNKYNKL